MRLNVRSNSFLFTDIETTCYRVEWTDGNGNSGHGDYCLSSDDADAWIEHLLIKYADMIHTKSSKCIRISQQDLKHVVHVLGGPEAVRNWKSPQLFRAYLESGDNRPDLMEFANDLVAIAERLGH